MLSMDYRGPYRVRATQKPVPEIEHPNDAVIRVTRAAICGSDLHLYHGLVPDTRVGTTFGHEFTGIVEEVGSDVQNLKVGDHVLVPFNISCGSCSLCQRQFYANCDNSNPNSATVGGIYGYSHTTGGYHGGQAEYVRVPYADIGPFKIPEGLSEDNALLLTDVIPTGYQAAEMGEIEEGDTVCVFGAGPVGIMAAKSAWLLGAGRVIVVDKEEYRLEFVRNFAGVETLNFEEIDDPVFELKKMTDWRGPDVCIDAVGAEASGSALQRFLGVQSLLTAGASTALVWAINAVRKAGRVSVVGVYGPTFNLVPIGNALNKGVNIRGNQANVKRYVPHLIDHILKGDMDPSQMITHKVPLEEVGDAYHLFSSKLDNCIKPVLIPPKALH